MRQTFFSKNCTNTETHSFADIYATRILDEENDHSFLRLVWLALGLFPCHEYWMPDLQKSININMLPDICYASYEISANYPLFLNIKLDSNKMISIFVAYDWISKIKNA